MYCLFGNENVTNMSSTHNINTAFSRPYNLALKSENVRMSAGCKGGEVDERIRMIEAEEKASRHAHDINARLQRVFKSEKYSLGYNTTLKTLLQGKAKLIVIANNCPALRKSEVEHHARLAKTGVHYFHGDNIELGTACGRYYRVSCLAITDPGDSDKFIDIMAAIRRYNHLRDVQHC